MSPEASGSPKYPHLVAGEKYCIKSRGCRSCSNEDVLKVITVEKIWRCTGNLLRLERGMMLKDVCLSMALSKMLNRRFSGFKLSEELPKTHDFVFKGLLLAGDKPHQRAYSGSSRKSLFLSMTCVTQDTLTSTRRADT